MPNHQDDLNLDALHTIEERKSLGQHVFETLRMAIIRGDMSSGSRVVESRIAEAIGISRTPVREAMHKLEREGLLERRPGKPLVVRPLAPRELEVERHARLRASLAEAARAARQLGVDPEDALEVYRELLEDAAREEKP